MHHRTRWTMSNLAVGATVAGLLSVAGVALAQEGMLPDIGINYEGRIVVITDTEATPATHCDRPFLEYRCVIISTGRAIVTTIGITPSAPVSAGDRFDILTQVPCDGRLDLTLKGK